MKVTKVNIDELIDVLMDMRTKTEYVDISIEDNNTLKVRQYSPIPGFEINDKDDKDDTFPDDISNLIA